MLRHKTQEAADDLQATHLGRIAISAMQPIMEFIGLWQKKGKSGTMRITELVLMRRQGTRAISNEGNIISRVVLRCDKLS
jgi:hypothetical protein